MTKTLGEKFAKYCKTVYTYTVYTYIDGVFRTCYSSLSEIDAEKYLQTYKKEDRRSFENSENKIWVEKHLLFLNIEGLLSKDSISIKDVNRCTFYEAFIKHLKEIL